MPSPSLNPVNKPTATNPPVGVPDRALFSTWTRRIQDSFANLTKDPSVKLFTCDVQDLFEVYLKALPEKDRQYHNCHCCRHFINRQGSLVVIDADGCVQPALWDFRLAPEYYEDAVLDMENVLRKSKITGVYVSGEKNWGTRETGDWRHFGVSVRTPYKNLLKTPYQYMAEKAEDHKNVTRALVEFPIEALDQALLILKSDELYRSEKVLDPVEWLHSLAFLWNQHKRQNERTNLVWKAVAAAPAGFCHPRSSMAGTLLEDIATGMPLEEVKKRFADKMHPLKYQRPVAAPTEGNIKRGEEIVAKLGIANSLKRRFATKSDVHRLVWATKPEKWAPIAEGVFGHLSPKRTKQSEVPVRIPESTMTWSKFERTVLPDALGIEVYVNPNDNFAPLLTAVDMDAPPILQWDTDEDRNPLSWWVWNGGSPAHRFNLESGEYAPVWGITLQPSMYAPHVKNFNNGVLFLIEGAADNTPAAGLGLFPEILKSELREIRSTIEAYSKAGECEKPVAGGDYAAGLLFQGPLSNAPKLRVRTALGYAIYKLDRWD